jgi:hypothetical protein
MGNPVGPPSTTFFRVPLTPTRGRRRAGIGIAASVESGFTHFRIGEHR